MCADKQSAVFSLRGRPARRSSIQLNQGQSSEEQLLLFAKQTNILTDRQTDRTSQSGHEQESRKQGIKAEMKEERLTPSFSFPDNTQTL